MSIDAKRIHCTQCDYETLEVHRPVVVIYVSGDGKLIEAGRTKGWCHDCEEYRDIENMDITQLERELIAQSQQVAEMRSQLKQLSKGFLNRFRNSSISTELRFELGWSEKKLHELSTLLEIARQRLAGPRCLHCWSERTTQVSFGDDGLSEDFVHRCGGALRVLRDEKAPRFHFRTTKYVLDTEGRLIEG